ncbi:MAG: (2Fe-2S) ferredoxin domain-containing protein [Spirochaetaceae bacterium]|nr:(2Fe-2S) ferredoxin domain-containing protein [Spirochaetaceae bacterium]
MKTVTICMGSSCFSRGNAANAEVVQRFIVENGLEDKVFVKGCLCEGECKNGPNVRIDGKLYTDVSPETLGDLLTKALEAE